MLLPSHTETSLPDAAVEGVLDGAFGPDGPCVWLRVAGTTEPRALRWPAGYRAHFRPADDGTQTFDILDQLGRVVAERGDRVVLGGGARSERLERCHVGREQVWYVSSVSVQGG